MEHTPAPPPSETPAATDSSPVTRAEFEAAFVSHKKFLNRDIAGLRARLDRWERTLRDLADFLESQRAAMLRPHLKREGE